MTAAHLIRIAQTITRRIAPGRAFLLALILTVIAAPSLAQSGLSGTYVSASPRSAEMIFMVQTPDGRITGRLESMTLDEAGKTSSSSFTLEGAGDGSTVMLTIRSTLLSLGSPPSLSGALDGDVLNLSWQGGHRAYRRGTAEQYRAAVVDLETRSDQIEAQTAFATAMASLARLTAILDEIEAGMPALHDQLATASERYRHLYSRMHNRRRAQTVLSNSPDQGLATMRAGTDAQSYALEINAVGLEVVRLRSEMHGQFGNARSLAASIDTYCADAPEAAETPACIGVAGQHTKLERLSVAAQAEFDATDSAYRQASVDVPPGRRLIESIVRR
ncbi:hypothetical protein [Brevundimonas naejangsanensis]|uniref:hypothetical protein n=1 Tax=Brevundimonas naejangsanensis TaxID=588932 RepID=UPI0026EBC207|nr:hypothetical protein [Brevundimonas naejangsanensis]